MGVTRESHRNHLGIKRSGFISKLVASPIQLQFKSNRELEQDWSYMGFTWELIMLLPKALSVQINPLSSQQCDAAQREGGKG